MKPKLLDLFCCAGGASTGYDRAGFDVTGVDIAPQKRYPFPFIQADALQYLSQLLDSGEVNKYAVIHASPPCQDISVAAYLPGTRKHTDSPVPRLIEPVRQLLRNYAGLWVIENVQNASPLMLNAIRICGTSLGCRVWRHRLFESNIMLFAPGPCQHRNDDITINCSSSRQMGNVYCTYTAKSGRVYKRLKNCRIAEARAAMGIDYAMTQYELGEAIPPAYTEWIGKQFMTALLQAA